MLINGKNLTPKQLEQVKAAFVHRNTVECPSKATVNDLIHGRVKDADWILARAFHFVKDGSRLSMKHKHCEPAYFAE